MTNIRYHLRRVNGVRAERAHKSEASHPRRVGGRGTFDRRRGTDADGRGSSRDGVHLSDDRVPVLPEPTRATGGRPPRDRGRIALPEDPPADVAARLDIVVAAYTRQILDNESQQRTMLRLSLEANPEERSQLPLRQGRVIKWLEEALAPLQLQLPRVEEEPGGRGRAVDGALRHLRD